VRSRLKRPLLVLACLLLLLLLREVEVRRERERRLSSVGSVEREREE